MINNEEKTTRESTRQRVSVLSMTNDEARSFFLESDSYCNFDLPPYFEFNQLLTKLDKCIRDNNEIYSKPNIPSKCANINHTILNNKDGRLAWRPLQLIHPALYVSLVHKLTESSSWDIILKRFVFFHKNPKIRCLSIPVKSSSIQRNKAHQVLQWWEKVEQASIELSLEYEFLAHADIADCYSSIYTHSIPWALHKRSVMKVISNRTDSKFIGNHIDWHLQDMNQSQTNGIPQGSVLMDFVAEIVLGYADFILAAKLKRLKITDYQILRYRDDYRIFTNHPTQGEEILKAISETMYCLGMKLNTSKTGVVGKVVRNSIKADKIEWLKRKQFAGDLQKQLWIIHDFSQKYPNSGSLMRALSKFHVRILKCPNDIRNASTMIALAVDITLDSPRVYPVASAIISKLICSIKDESLRMNILKKIKKRFERIPNTGYLQVWLQRISYHHDKSLKYSEPLCQMVEGFDLNIWNNSWIKRKDLNAILAQNKIFNEGIINQLNQIIQYDEFKLFEYENDPTAS